MSSARIALLTFVLLLSAGIAPATPSQRSASAPAAKGRNSVGRKELDNRATQQLIQLVDGSPEYRLFIGKYHLNLEHYDTALAEFQAAAEADPKLPFVHFNLGLTYREKQDFPRAHDEFQKDELEAAVNIDNEHRAAREKQMEQSPVSRVTAGPPVINSAFAVPAANTTALCRLAGGTNHETRPENCRHRRRSTHCDRHRHSLLY